MADLNADTKPLKRESPFEESSLPKRTKRSQDGAYIKLEPNDFAKNYDFDDSDDSDNSTGVKIDEPDAAPAPPSVPLSIPPSIPLTVPPSAPQSDPTPAFAPTKANEILNSSIIKSKLETAAEIAAKMNSIHDIYEREASCCAEIMRISAELKSMEDMASEFLGAGKAKWLISRVSALTEEKEILRTMLERTKQKQVRRESRLRKREQEKRLREQQEAEQKRELEAKRLSNKQQIKSEGGKKVPQVDLTKAPKVVVNINPNAKAETLRAFKKVETKYIVKQKADVKEKSKIKIEPKIKLEED